MRRYETIDEAILNKDIPTLRESIGNLCYLSRDFSDPEFDEVIEYVISKGIDLKDSELKGDLVSVGKDSYTNEDFSKAVYWLKENFCDERIEDVKKIGKALERTKATENAPVREDKSDPPKVPSHSVKQEGPWMANNSMISKVPPIAWIILGAIILLVIYLTTKK